MKWNLFSEPYRNLADRLLTDCADIDLNADRFNILCCDDDASPMLRFVRSHEISTASIGKDSNGAYLELKPVEGRTFIMYLKNLNVIELAYLIFSV